MAFLFPGQGSQQPEMLNTLPDHPIVNETIDEASEVLDENVKNLDDVQKLKSNRNVQVCLLIAGVATARMLKSEGVRPDMVAGHSVGAFGAAVTAAVLDFRDALLVVRRRGQWMEEAFPTGYGMGVISGLRKRKVEEILEGESGDNESVYLANMNSIDQFTISGTTEGVGHVLEVMRKEGAWKAERLNVNVPSHCPLMEKVAERLADILKDIPFQPPTVPYAGNRNARALRDTNAIKEDLAESVAHPVRWHDAVSLYYELGARLFLEVLPGRVLTDLNFQSFPTARSLSVCASGWQSAQILINRA
ncbi:malonate decarboxylase subunit epsilon [Alkalihalobacillus sp. TS-13]|uniref:malonate decarboxylase subunit epsilon n=1 Tax=Alkalihalobacillus sp. TS-13 TaxID=2842455 RepID=UPI002893181A|nr:malonate decarboxylase subunit epsilon [Alkalihalobacillus sp. TS-13]